MTFLFWSLNGRPIIDRVAELTAMHDVDLLLLAECKTSPAKVLYTLNPTRDVRWAFAPTPVPTLQDLQLYVRGLPSFVRPKYDLPRASIREIQFPASPPITLVMAHLQSPQYLTD